MSAKKTDAYWHENVLRSWAHFNVVVLSLTIPELEHCLTLELAGKRRQGIIQRLQSRICRLERGLKFNALRTKMAAAK